MLVPPLPATTAPARLQDANAELRRRLEQTPREAVTGRRSDLTAHLSGRVGEAMLSKKTLDDITLEREQLGLRANRLSVTQLSLNAIQESASGIDVATNDALGRQDDLALSLASDEAETALGRIFDALNARHGERFLFSGDETGQPPFGGVEDLLQRTNDLVQAATTPDELRASIDAFFDPATGDWANTVYQGTQGASDPDAVLAIDPAITELVRGLSIIAVSDPQSAPAVLRSEPEITQDAAASLASGRDSVILKRADLGAVQESVQRQIDQLAAEETVATELFNAMTGRDAYEAATELRELETNLQASYLLTSRLADLTFVNFVR